MLLIIHNLPATTRYADIKSLLQTKCDLQQVILDNLVSEGNSKKVTVGVAEEADAAIMVRKINGLYWNGQQLFVEDVRQNKAASDKPYHPKPQAQPETLSMDLAQNSCYNMMAAQQMAMYFPTQYTNTKMDYTYFNQAPYGYPGMQKVQSAYPGISGFTQNAAMQYAAPNFNQEDYSQPAKRPRWEDNLENQSANDQALYGQRNDDQNQDWYSKRKHPQRDMSRENRPVWESNPKVDSNQPDFRNIRPNPPDFGPNARPTQPEFRSHVRPTEPQFRSSVREDDRSDFVRPKQPRRFDANNPRPNDSDLYHRRSAQDDCSRRSNEAFSRNQEHFYSGSDREEPSRRRDDRDDHSRRPNEPWRPNDRDDRSRPKERADYSRRSKHPRWSNEPKPNQLEGPNDFHEREKPNRFDSNYDRSGAFRREDQEREYLDQPKSAAALAKESKRKHDPKDPSTWRRPPPPHLAHKQSIAKAKASAALTDKKLPDTVFPSMTTSEEALQPFNRKNRMIGCHKILNDIYMTLHLKDQDQEITRALRIVVRERVNVMTAQTKTGTPVNFLEMYRAKYPKSSDQTAYNIAIERMSNKSGKADAKIAQELNAGQKDKEVKQPPPKLTKGQLNARRNMKEAETLISQGKIPTFPLGDKSQVSQHKKEEKEGMIPDMDPITRKVLSDELDDLIKFFAVEFNNPPDQTSRQVYAIVSLDDMIDDIKKILTQTVSRRITDWGLKVVRVYGLPTLPKREILEKYLVQFGVQSLRKSEKAKMYTAAVDTYENYDRLLSKTFDAPDGNVVTFKPFHVTPKVRANQTSLRKIRQQVLSEMIDRSRLNILDKNWPAKDAEIKAKQAEKKAELELQAEIAALEKKKSLENEENQEPVGNPVIKNAGTTNNDSEVEEIDFTADVNNDLLDSFYTVDEVNEMDSDIEHMGEIQYVGETAAIDISEENDEMNDVINGVDVEEYDLNDSYGENEVENVGDDYKSDDVVENKLVDDGNVLEENKNVESGNINVLEENKNVESGNIHVLEENKNVESGDIHVLEENKNVENTIVNEIENNKNVNGNVEDVEENKIEDNENVLDDNDIDNVDIDDVDDDELEDY